MRCLLVFVVVAACSSKHHESAPPLVATAAFVDVTVVAMDTERELGHQTVLVDGAKIVAIGPTASVPVPANAQRIDGKGKWLIPGLVDAHVHFNEARDAILYVANGVTTVRNMWGNPETLRWRGFAKANEASWIGPSIYTAGPIVDGNPPSWPGSAVVETPEAAKVEVANEKAAGYDFVKVYDGLAPDVYAALHAAAQQAGLRLAGHAPKRVPLADVLANQASIEHLTAYLDAKTELDDAKMAALAEQTAAAKVANTPTLVVLDRVGRLDHPEALLARPENKYVSPITLATWDPKADFRFHDATPERFEAMRRMVDAAKRMTKALQDKGAVVLAGTDTPNPFVVPGFSMHEELALLVSAGLTPYQAMRAATVAPAQWIGGPTFGVIAVDARADLVLLDADPLLDVAATTKRTGVMLRGRWFPQAELNHKLDAVVAPADPFAAAPPLKVDGEEVFAATYIDTLNGKPIGKERLAIGQRPDGTRVIAAQAMTDSLLVVRIELDARGRLLAFDHDKGGVHTAATLANGKLVVNGKSQPALADIVLDADVLAAMIPIAARAVAGKKTIVEGFTIPDLNAVRYEFDRTANKPAWGLLVTSSFGPAPGSYEVDAKGFPVAVSLKTGFGEIAVKRESP